MRDRCDRTTATDPDRRRVGFLTRVAVGTLVGAGIVGALATTPAFAGDTARPTCNAAVTVPLQPPVPPGPPVPPPMHQPGQAGPDTSIHDTPPPPAEPDPLTWDWGSCDVW